MTQYSEQQLATNIKAGDEKSFEYAFNAYAQGLIAYAATIIKDADEAEDIVQQLFVQLWFKRNELMVNTTIKGYLYRAVHNSCLNKVKQQQVRSSYALHYEAVGNKTTGSVAEVLENKELTHAINLALEELPELCRKIFMMSKYQLLKYQQIADDLGIPIKTVENQMGKALKLLRPKLQHLLPLFIINFLLNS